MSSGVICVVVKRRAGDRQALIDLLSSNDDQKIRDTLDGLPAVGSLRVPGESSRDIRYAWKVEQNGQTLVTVMSDRPFLSTPGATSDGRVGYLVMVGQFALDSNGEGTGAIAPAIEPRFGEDGSLTIEHSAADPVKLTKVVRH